MESTNIWVKSCFSGGERCGERDDLYDVISIVIVDLGEVALKELFLRKKNYLLCMEYVLCFS